MSISNGVLCSCGNYLNNPYATVDPSLCDKACGRCTTSVCAPGVGPSDIDKCCGSNADGMTREAVFKIQYKSKYLIWILFSHN